MGVQSELSWIAEGRKLIGNYEIAGKKDNPVIMQLWKDVFDAQGKKNWINTEETPWCGAFVGAVLVRSNLLKHVPKFFFRALEWNLVGRKLSKPAYGCVVVMSRKGGGHVGFCVGKDQSGNIMILGGNQGNGVNIKPFNKERIVGYRWCGTQPLPNESRYDLPILKSDGRLSTNEA